MRYVLAIALVLAVPAAAGPVPDGLVLSSRGELHLIDATGAVTGTVSGFSPCCAAWSPDGTRFSFVDATVRRRLLVAAADGSGVREVVSGDVSGVPVWVSSGELAVNLGAGSPYSLWIVPIDGGSPRLLTNASDGNYPLVMQPQGSLLLYTVVVPPGRLRRAVIDVRTGSATVLPTSPDVVWSPDGHLLAAPTSVGIEVLRPDGTGRRPIVTGLTSHTAAPVWWLAWSPDGSRLAYTRRREFPELTSRYGTPVRDEIYSVGIDGSDPVRLTGVAGDDLGAGSSYGSLAPAWWPGGSRLFFKRSGRDGILTMNDDGSCEAPWPGPDAYAHPLWRPGATITGARVTCSSVIVRLRTPLAEVSYRDALPLTIVVRNDGTRMLRDVRLSLGTTHGALAAPECGVGARVVCRLGDVAVGGEAVLRAETRFQGPGRARVSASATFADHDDIDPGDDTVTVERDVSPCELLGTWGADRLIGTSRQEWICARPGWDYIDARGGNDRIDAGAGVDTVVAGPGRDVVTGGGGGDTIRVRDGQRDVVDCGTETDVVLADRTDVLRHCEKVQRR